MADYVRSRFIEVIVVAGGSDRTFDELAWREDLIESSLHQAVDSKFEVMEIRITEGRSPHEAFFVQLLH